MAFEAITIGVHAQEAAIARLDSIRDRALTRRESEMLSELLRLQEQRARKRRSRELGLQARIEQQLAQLIGPFAGKVTA